MAEDITDNKNNIEQHDDSHDHEYDGIKELKNPAPYWVLLLFFATIAFSGCMPSGILAIQTTKWIRPANIWHLSKNINKK